MGKPDRRKSTRSELVDDLVSVVERVADMDRVEATGGVSLKIFDIDKVC